MFIRVKLYENKVQGNTEGEYAKWGREDGWTGKRKGGNGAVGSEQWAADFFVFSSLSHFVEPALWALKLGVQVSRLTKVHLPGTKRTCISIQSTFYDLVYLPTFCELRD